MRSREIENEIQRARQQIHEETKDMTVEERVEHMNKRGEELAEKYGFKILTPEEVDELRNGIRKAVI